MIPTIGSADRAIKDLQAISAGSMHMIARLQDRKPAEFKVLTRAVQARLKEARPPRADGRDDEAATLGVLLELIGPITRDLMQDNDVRSALGRLAQEFAQIEATDGPELTLSAASPSVGPRMFAAPAGLVVSLLYPGLAIAVLVVGVGILVWAADEIEAEKKKNEDEDYEP
ncbi:hypothetical protein ABEG18_14845 [Alsobacter sp. KACC 23698]|uniref:DUF4342 domain-containing protein n=1 Tax=Alsobacter sp. KACC 23698 TaxID=3149229 RepID=A0AAU7J9Q0_9HYPH